MPPRVFSNLVIWVHRLPLAHSGSFGPVNLGSALLMSKFIGMGTWKQSSYVPKTFTHNIIDGFILISWAEVQNHAGEGNGQKECYA